MTTDLSELLSQALATADDADGAVTEVPHTFGQHNHVYRLSKSTSFHTQHNLATGKVRQVFLAPAAPITPQAAATAVGAILTANVSAQAVIAAQLEQIIGQEGIKAALRTFADTVSFTQLQRELEGANNGTITAAQPPVYFEPIASHMVLTGPPGTGKTSVAFAIAKILHAIGRLPRATLVTVTPKDLIDGYVGQTASKTARVIERAVGGVLFIDEAYTIADNTHFGPECLAELIVQMTNHREDLVVIIAGYGEKIARLFAMNPGLQSRFPEKLRFDMKPFSVDDLVAILRAKARSERYQIALDVDLSEFINSKSTAATRAKENGRLVENLYSAVKERLAERIMCAVRQGQQPAPSDLRLLIKADFF
jgi:SpoVK/Ycf46/Vps4 family AAA+-type ATPase